MAYTGGVDIWTSRRKNFLECLYYKRNITQLTDITNSTIPEGSFYAKEEGNYDEKFSNNNNIIGYVPSNLVISTYDDVNNSKINDIIVIDGVKKIYRVQRISQKRVRNQNQFLYNTSFKTVIYLEG